jgi:FSR family fosmidomycin resistance protein-like MFS transporter
MADRTGIEYVYSVCAFLPMIGILAVFLPNLDHLGEPAPMEEPAKG